jgi:hypothetical protein
VAHRDLCVPAGEDSKNDGIGCGDGDPWRECAQDDQADPGPGHYALHGCRDDAVKAYGKIPLTARMTEDLERLAETGHRSSSASNL